MFETIAREAQSGGDSGAPQWMSSHPDPGNRTAYITKEAEALTLGSPANTSQFAPIKATFASLPPAKSMGDLARGKDESTAPGRHRWEPPGSRCRDHRLSSKDINGGKVFQASVPSDWTTLASKSAIKVVPQNGYGQLNGQTIFSHGVEFGITKAGSRNLQDATNTWLKAIAQDNPQLRLAGNQQATRISQRSAIVTPLSNPRRSEGRS